jgi:RNA polymerase sigma factor (sigma-70 family)
MTASPALLLARLAARADVSGPDADLLARFRRGRDEAAFAELVRRHGPAVFRVCRRLVGPAAADDAFQATFLVLATRADSVKSPGAVGPYLVGVAGRVARQMRTARLRRHAHEAAFAADPLRPTSDTPASLDLAEEARLLDEELTRLPDRLRGPLVLCMVEGRTHDQAAADLGGSPRTVRRQLVEAKRLLRLRLERRGVVPAVAAALAAGAGGGAAAVPVGLGPRTVAAVFDFLAGGVATTAVPGVVAKGVVTAMIARKLALVLTAAAVGLTAVGVGVGGAGDGPGPAKPADGPPAATTGPAKPGSSVAASDNFAVTAPTLEAAQTILSAAEGLRKRVALDWTGADLPVWETPCLVRYSPTGATPAGTLNGNPPIYYEESIARPERTDFAGATYVRFPPPAGRPGVRALDIVLSGDLPKVVAEPLPRQVRAAVLATVVGRPVPTWTGWVFPHLGEQPWPDDPDHIRRVQRAKSDGHLLTVRQLLGVRKPPTGMAADEARGTADQATSLAHFLLSRGPTGASAIPPVQAARRKLVRFVTAGVRDGWDQAANDVYGFWTVERLEEAWLASLGDPVPPDTTAAASGTHDTANFTVTAPTPELAREVGTAAERFWAELSAAWLGTDPATWPRRAPTRPRLWVIKADYGPGVGPHSGTEVAVDKDGDNAIMIRVGSNRRDELFNDLLPAQLTQAVLAAYVGRKIPHWLARGGRDVGHDGRGPGRRGPPLPALDHAPAVAAPVAVRGHGTGRPEGHVRVSRRPRPRPVTRPVLGRATRPEGLHPIPGPGHGGRRR